MSVLNAPTPIEKAPKLAAGRIPIMAFVADAESEAAVHECLAQLSLTNAVLVRGGIAKAVQYLGAERSPHLLIVDVSDVDLPVSQIHTLAEVCEPGVTVIAVGKRNDVGLYRDLLHAGVSDYIVKPLTPKILANALRVASHEGGTAPISQKLGKVVSFTGARGGVGTTTLAVNVAWYLANQQGRRVALVDLDLQNGDCGLALNIKSTPGLREALANPLRVDAILIERAMTLVGDRLFVLSAEEKLFDEAQFTSAGVETLLSILRQQFHYVVLDVPRMRSAAYRRAFEMADIRVLVADQTLGSVRDIARWKTAFDEGGSENRNLLVINRAGEGGRHGVRLREMGDTLSMQPKCVIPFEPKWFAAGALDLERRLAKRRGKVTDAIALVALEISGQSVRPRRWWRFGS
jgi:pilus assembly protein CpaE